MSLLRRRRFLEALAKANIALPLLPSLARATPTQFNAISPRRLVIVFSGNGQDADFWYPKGVVPPKINSETRGMPLDAIPNQISEIFDSKFNKFRKKMNLIRGLDIISTLEPTNHNPAKQMNGHGQAINPMPTIDQVIAQSRNFYPNDPYARVVLLQNVGLPATPGESVSVDLKRQYVAPLQSPKIAKNRLFKASFSNPSIKSFLEEEFAYYLNKGDLSKLDREKLEKHLTFVRSVAVEQSRPSLRQSADSDYKTCMEYVDITATALKSDLSRIFTISLADSSDSKNLPYIPGNPQYHMLSHLFKDPVALDNHRLVQKFHANIFFQLLELLDDVEDEETGRTYLDNSLVMWVGEQCVRVNDDTAESSHGNDDLPVMMVGDLGGYFKTGMYLDYRTSRKKKLVLTPKSSTPHGAEHCAHDGSVCYRGADFANLGRPYNELLVTILRGMGLDWSEFELYGPGFGDYSDNFFDQYDISNRRRLLEEIIA